LPAGNISSVERFKRLHEIKAYSEEGKTDNEIAKLTGMSIMAVKRNKKYLEELSVADLTSEEIGKKRGEIYVELVEATLEAQKMFEKYRDSGEPNHAKKFFSSWLEAIQMRARLYGLDNIKADSYLQINQQFNAPIVPDRIDVEVGERIAKMLKDSHENKIRKTYEEKSI
jgi:predicted transcriptional regulator